MSSTCRLQYSHTHTHTHETPLYHSWSIPLYVYYGTDARAAAERTSHVHAGPTVRCCTTLYCVVTAARVQFSRQVFLASVYGYISLCSFFFFLSRNSIVFFSRRDRGENGSTGSVTRVTGRTQYKHALPATIVYTLCYLDRFPREPRAPVRAGRFCG